MIKPKVSIIIPNYNGENLISKTLPSVLSAYRYKRNNIKEIIVVDDDSSDQSVKLIKENFPEIKLIKPKENRGFSSSINTGARTAKSALLCLLNTDVLVSKNFLISALPHFSDKRVFAVSLNEKGYSWAKGRFEGGVVIHDKVSVSSRVHDTFWVNGGSGVFRRRYFMRLKGMDEELFSPFYWEDVDLSYRAQKRGYLTLWEPNANVVHKHESTIAKFSEKSYRDSILERNQLIFIWKNITSPFLFRKHIIGLFKRVITAPGYIKVVIRVLRCLKPIMKARKRELKRTKVSDETIFAKFD